MDDIAETLTWPFRDQRWLPKALVQGLILLVPVLGVVALLGWMLESIQNVREGRNELARPSFYVSRGWPLLAVEVAYVLVIFVVAKVLTASGGSHHNLFLLGQLWSVVASVGLIFLFPALVLAVSREGFAAGLDFWEVVNLGRMNPQASFGAAMICFLAAAVGLLGLAACLVGVVFTEAYAAAVMVAAVSWLDRQLGPAPRNRHLSSPRFGD